MGSRFDYIADCAQLGTTNLAMSEQFGMSLRDSPATNESKAELLDWGNTSERKWLPPAAGRRADEEPDAPMRETKPDDTVHGRITHAGLDRRGRSPSELHPTGTCIPTRPG